MPFISPTPTLESFEPPDVCETPRARMSESAASCHEEDAHDKPNFDTIALALIKIATEVGKLNNVSDMRILSATILPAIQCLSKKIDYIEASMKAELSQVKAQVDALCWQAEARPSGEARDRRIWKRATWPLPGKQKLQHCISPEMRT